LHSIAPTSRLYSADESVMLLEHCCSNRNRYSHGFSSPTRITIRLTRHLLFRLNPNTDIRVRSDAESSSNSRWPHFCEPPDLKNAPKETFASLFTPSKSRGDFLNLRPKPLIEMSPRLSGGPGRFCSTRSEKCVVASSVLLGVFDVKDQSENQSSRSNT
jgi:hypothetical protein